MPNSRMLSGLRVLTMLFASAACDGVGGREPSGAVFELAKKNSREMAADMHLKAWIRENTERFEGAELTPDAFTVLASEIGNKRIVMLGEEERGAIEFGRLKLSIVRALHEQAGFNVIAFEGPVWSCAPGLNPSLRFNTKQLLEQCSAESWLEPEVRELFEYVASTQRTSNPLVLVGVDPTQFRSVARHSTLEAFAGAIGQDLVAIRTFDTVMAQYLTKEKDFKLIRPYPVSMAAQMDSVSQWFSGRAADAEELVFARNALAAATFRTNARMARVLSEHNGLQPATRDVLIAENVAFVADTLFPTQKVMVWTRNKRVIRPNLVARKNMPPSSAVLVERTTGNAVYAIGLYASIYSTIGPPETSVLDSPPEDRSVLGLLHDDSSRTVLLTSNALGKASGAQWLSQRFPEPGRSDSSAAPGSSIDYDAVLMLSRVTPTRQRYGVAWTRR